MWGKGPKWVGWGWGWGWGWGGVNKIKQRLMKHTRIAGEIFKQHPLILHLKCGDKNLQG